MIGTRRRSEGDAAYVLEEHTRETDEAALLPLLKDSEFGSYTC